MTLSHITDEELRALAADPEALKSAASWSLTVLSWLDAGVRDLDNGGSLDMRLRHLDDRTYVTGSLAVARIAIERMIRDLAVDHECGEEAD